MRARRRYRPSPYRGPRLRPWGMIFLLVLLAIYIPRARDPKNWAWLASDTTDYRPDVTTKAVVQPSQVVKGEQVVAKPVTVDKGKVPLDQNPDEIKAFRKQSEVLIDKAIFLSGFEMPAYWRLVRWAQDSTLKELEKRASRGVVFTHLVQKPSQIRGKLVRLKLNVRRVLPCAVEPTQPKDIPQLYEVWGFAEESQAWLYVVITPDLPAGLPIGPRVNEEVTFCGYFLKLQGYHEAGAKPNARPLYAPLLIGRMALAKPLPPPPVTSFAAGWVTAAVVLAGAGGLLVWLVVRLRPSRRTAPASGPPLPWQHDDTEDEDAAPPWSFTADGTVQFGDESNAEQEDS